MSTNRNFQEVVSLSGVVATPRKMSAISHEMLPDIETRDEVAAHIGWALRNCITDLPNLPGWLHTGVQNRSLLPWEQGRAAYEARPRCSIDREWFKLALKTLSAALQDNSPDADQQVAWSFDGEILRVRFGLVSIPIPATGHSWPSSYSVQATKLANLPKQFRSPSVEVSIWRDRLTLGNRQYSIV